MKYLPSKLRLIKKDIGYLIMHHFNITLMTFHKHFLFYTLYILISSYGSFLHKVI